MVTRAKPYSDTRCSALLKLPFPVQCSWRASVERGGRFYCKLHDPRRDRMREAEAVVSGWREPD
jgi:hypothetical protein